MRAKRALGTMLFGTWVLVQVPGKDIKLSNPGSNMPPITKFTRVREFPSADACESFRNLSLQDAAGQGSDAMLAQSSTLRCVRAEDLPGTTPSPAATRPHSPVLVHALQRAQWLIDPAGCAES